MPQPQVRQHPGFGIVYPGGGDSGIKIVGAFTQAPKKVFNPDGSISYEAPAPTIYELFGGGFTYVSGKPVTKREELENITDKTMRDRALIWYDTHGKAISPPEVVPREEEKERPEPAYILSTQLPIPEDEVTKSINEQQVIREKTEDSSLVLAKAISELATLVKKQGEEIAQLKIAPVPKEPKRRGTIQSQKMKEKWADPAWREKRKKAKGASVEIADKITEEI